MNSNTNVTNISMGGGQTPLTGAQPAGGRGMMGGMANMDEISKKKKGFWCWFCFCQMPCFLILIALSAVIGYLNANAKMFYVAFNYPTNIGSYAGGSVHLCGSTYDSIADRLFEDYYRSPLIFDDDVIQRSDLYVEIDIDVDNSDTYAERLTALQDKVTNYYHSPINVTLDPGAGGLTIGFNVMGALENLDLDSGDTGGMLSTMRRAKAWCDDQIIQSAYIDMGIVAGASFDDIMNSADPAINLIGDGFGAYVGNYIPEEIMIAMKEWLFLGDESDDLASQLVAIHPEIFIGAHAMWDMSDIEELAENQMFAGSYAGLRSAADLAFTVDTYDAAAMNIAGYVSYTSAYEGAVSDWNQYYDDDEDAQDDDDYYDDRQNEDSVDLDMQWMDYQMELFGILNAMLIDIDNDITLSWATPTTHYQAAGEMTLYGDGLGEWLHAMFKIFIYYPFDRAYDAALTGMKTEHDCWEDWNDRSDQEICVPGCRDDCSYHRGDDSTCAIPMIISIDNQYASEDGDNDYKCIEWSSCNVFRKNTGADSDSETVEGEFKFWECQWNDAPYTREYGNLWGESDDTGGTMASLGESMSWGG